MNSVFDIGVRLDVRVRAFPLEREFSSRQHDNNTRSWVNLAMG